MLFSYQLEELWCTDKQTDMCNKHLIFQECGDGGHKILLLEHLYIYILDNNCKIQQTVFKTTHFASLLWMTGGSCSGSPTSTNFVALKIGPRHAACTIWEASSTIHTSNVR